MIRPAHLCVLIPLLSGALVIPACDSDNDKPEVDPLAEKKAKEEAEMQAAIERRKQERLQKEEEEKRKEEEIKQKIQEITVIPEDAKLPKKVKAACEEVVQAQEAFMKKFHPQVDDAALTTQLGMLRKQCNEMKDIKVSMCQKYALEVTTEDLKTAINEYLPACMEKYGPQAAKGN